MEKLPYHYRLTIYTNTGKRVKQSNVYSEINLDGILREDLFIIDDPDTHISHVERIK